MCILDFFFSLHLISPGPQHLVIAVVSVRSFTLEETERQK